MSVPNCVVWCAGVLLAFFFSPVLEIGQTLSDNASIEHSWQDNGQLCCFTSSTTTDQPKKNPSRALIQGHIDTDILVGTPA